MKLIGQQTIYNVLFAVCDTSMVRGSAKTMVGTEVCNTSEGSRWRHTAAPAEHSPQQQRLASLPNGPYNSFEAQNF